MTEKENIEFLRTLRVIARNASDTVREKVLLLVNQMVDCGKTFRVILEDYPEVWSECSQGYYKSKIRAIKALRTASNNIGRPLSLRDAKEMSERIPCVVFGGLMKLELDIVQSEMRLYDCPIKVQEEGSNAQ